ncbi:MAG: aldo/keto reductase family protein, partial [Candidatus Marinimicrobia bacterium]|nr:aldo/keto reductase family protein [Candidatus Neomarinimicrobiota bacterium]
RFGENDHRRMNLSSEKLDCYLTELDDLEPVFEEHSGFSKAQVSLAFCLNHPACHSVIPGGKTPEQVIDNCRAAAINW